MNLKVTYYGHSCFGVKHGSQHLLFDPFVTGNPLAKGVDVNSLPADYILVSHAHGDHTGDLLAVAKRTGATVIANWEICQWAEKQGLKTHAMNTGGGHQFPFGYVKLTAAEHSSSFTDGSYGGNPVGFVVETNHGTFYYAGDTALFSDMELIRNRFDIDFAFLPIGSNFTMDVEDACEAARLIGVNKVIGMHYDSFPPIVIDHEAARKHFDQHDHELILMEIGQSMVF